MISSSFVKREDNFHLPYNEHLGYFPFGTTLGTLTHGVPSRFTYLVFLSEVLVGQNLN